MASKKDEFDRLSEEELCGISDFLQKHISSIKSLAGGDPNPSVRKHHLQQKLRKASEELKKMPGVEESVKKKVIAKIAELFELLTPKSLEDKEQEDYDEAAQPHYLEIASSAAFFYLRCRY